MLLRASAAGVGSLVACPSSCYPRPHPFPSLSPACLPPCRISGAFYCTVTWLPAELRKQGMNPILCQGAVIVSMLANALGLLSVGVAFDCGMRAVYANAAVVFLGVGTGEPP